MLRKVVAANPGNANLRRDLSTGINKIADALTLLGQPCRCAGALSQQSLALVEALAKSDPANLQWQSDVAFAETRIGMLLAVEGRRPEALDAYRRAAAIREAIAEQTSARTASGSAIT